MPAEFGMQSFGVIESLACQTAVIRARINGLVPEKMQTVQIGCVLVLLTGRPQAEKACKLSPLKVLSAHSFVHE